MCPADDAHRTLQFNDHYVIGPTISFSQPVNHEVNAMGEVGQPVSDGFEYNSGTNPCFLNVEELRDLFFRCKVFPTADKQLAKQMSAL
jgi:UDP-N-acetylglucosamine 4,6-dehydratase